MSHALDGKQPHCKRCKALYRRVRITAKNITAVKLQNLSSGLSIILIVSKLSTLQML